MDHKILRDELSKYLDGKKDIFFHFKGRVSLYAILKAMKIGPGDEVIIPAFTCVVVPNPIIYLGAKPVYADIEPDTFNISVSKLKEAITPKTKVIICQNTFGLSSNIEEIINIARQNKLFTIEDCTHGYGGTYKGKANGTYCDASFFSSQWNKPFSSGVGGYALINNPDLLPAMQALEEKKENVSLLEKINLKALIIVRRNFLNNASYFLMVRFYRWLSKNKLILGSSSGKEISSVNKPKVFFKGYSNIQAKEALKNLKNLDQMLELRKKNAQTYSIFLKEKGKNHVPMTLFENHSFLKYPLLVKDREQFFKRARHKKIPLGDWFISPIHPVNNSYHLWHFDPQKFPTATAIAKKMVNLPLETHNTDKVIRFLTENLDLIEGDKL